MRFRDDRFEFVQCVLGRPVVKPASNVALAFLTPVTVKRGSDLDRAMTLSVRNRQDQGRRPRGV